jgi:hypothetical protein
LIGQIISLFFTKYFAIFTRQAIMMLMHERRPEINNVSAKVVLLLSSVALLAVLSGFTQPPQTDKGTAAHIFQLSIVALGPAILLFIATADRGHSLRSVRPLVLPGVHGAKVRVKRRQADVVVPRNPQIVR